MKTIRLSVLFSDIKGYTSLSKKLSPGMLNTLLEEYITEMSLIIKWNQGTIDKILGDGIMVFFKPSKESRNHEARAVAAALEMQEKIIQLRPRWQAAGKGVDLWVRIGIATGQAAMGQIKLDNHSEFTLVGEHVNLAARLQKKAPPGGILIDRDTYLNVMDLFRVEKIENIEIKGFDDTLTGYLVKEQSLQHPESLYLEGKPGRGPETRPLESRRHPRRNWEIDINYEAAERTRTSRSINISEGGVLIETEQPEPAGAYIVVHAKFPISMGTVPIQIHSRVARVAKNNGIRGMGVEFLFVRSGSSGTTSHLVREIFSLGKIRGHRPKDDFVRKDEYLRAIGVTPMFQGSELPLTFEELGTGGPDYISTRVAHEFYRTKRYGSDFSCMAVRVHHLDTLGDNESIAEMIREIAQGLMASIRSTDELSYLEDGVFFIISPETMLDRAQTLTQRVVAQVHSRLQKLAKGSPDLVLQTGIFSFDGQNAATPGDVIQATMADL